jgi:hypothetical protein
MNNQQKSKYNQSLETELSFCSPSKVVEVAALQIDMSHSFCTSLTTCQIKTPAEELKYQTYSTDDSKLNK